jgi:hypothetical protein
VGKAQSVTVRHLNVADDQVHAATKLFHDLKGVGTVFGFQRSEILSLQDSADVPANGWLIINNERNWHICLDGHHHLSVTEKSGCTLVTIWGQGDPRNSSKEPP